MGSVRPPPGPGTEWCTPGPAVPAAPRTELSRPGGAGLRWNRRRAMSAVVQRSPSALSGTAGGSGRAAVHGVRGSGPGRDGCVAGNPQPLPGEGRRLLRGAQGSRHGVSRTPELCPAPLALPGLERCLGCPNHCTPRLWQRHSQPAVSRSGIEPSTNYFL